MTVDGLLTFDFKTFLSPSLKGSLLGKPTFGVIEWATIYVVPWVNKQANFMWTGSQPYVNKKPTLCKQEANLMWTGSQPYVNRKPTLGEQEDNLM